MKSRVVILVLFFVALFATVIGRMFYLQVLPNQALEKLRKTQYTTMVSLPSQRGKIIDRKGEELATSVTAQSLYADPQMIKAPRRLAKKMAGVLGMTFKEVYALLTAEKRFVWIKRRLDDDLVSEIKDWHEEGLRFVEEGRRAYPNQALLSQVLGFVGSDGDGLEGLEKKYDAELRGEKQSILSKRDARGRPLVVSGQIFELHADGATLETTIDKDLQYELEHELESVVTNQEAEKATGVIMDPSTGEVLAMGSYPTFDSAKGGQSNPENRRNRAVSDIYEPGSTFKVVTAAAALRTGRIKPNTKFFCENGKFKIGKYTIHEAEAKHNFEWLSLAEILEVSSNIGTTKIAFDVGEAGFRKMIHDFGFYEKTGIDFPGEATGLVNPGNGEGHGEGRWPDIVLSNVSFGHGIGVTAIQMARVYSAIANGGKLLKPYIVRRVLDSDGHLVEERKPEVAREVLTPKEASTLTMMLSGVTEEGGTGVLARVDGYPVAGKTGTAQKVNPAGRGYIRGAYVSSFIGFVPANNPQFTIYVVVDHPKKQFYGAQVAAPSFQHLASFALHQKGFMPIVVANPVMPLAQNNRASGKSKAPSSVGGATSASPGQSLKTAESTAALQEGAPIPDFTGLTVREVSQTLQRLGGGDPRRWGEVQLLGTGVAHSQWPAPGAHVNKNQKLKVIFKPAG